MNQAENIIGALGDANLGKAAGIIEVAIDAVLSHEVTRNQAISLIAGGVFLTAAFLAKQL